jgi:hypothetical protein
MTFKRSRGRPKSPPKFRELMEELMPTEEIFEEDEIKMYEGLISIYLKDFDEENLTANDMDDLMGIALNKVLEMRLLKDSKGAKTDKLLDASASIEKIRKQTEKLKENLATRRKDRIDPKKFSGFSIVDLAVSYDMEKKREMMDKATKFRKEEEKTLESELLIGNKNDPDVEAIDTDE